MSEKKKRSESQLKAIRRSYARKAKKGQTSDRKGKEDLTRYNRIAKDYEKDPNQSKKLSDYAKKGLKIQKDSVNPKILDNPWNVHHTRTDKHPKIVMERKDDNFLIAHTTTESKDKDKKIRIQDGLYEGQKEPTFVKVTTKVIPKDKLQSKIKKSRVTTRDKVYIYDSIKDRDVNKKKYRELGNKKDRTESVSAYQGSHPRKPRG